LKREQLPAHLPAQRPLSSRSALAQLPLSSRSAHATKTVTFRPPRCCHRDVFCYVLNPFPFPLSSRSAHVRDQNYQLVSRTGTGTEAESKREQLPAQLPLSSRSAHAQLTLSSRSAHATKTVTFRPPRCCHRDVFCYVLNPFPFPLSSRSAHFWDQNY
jgi:hypothetical protein